MSSLWFVRLGGRHYNLPGGGVEWLDLDSLERQPLLPEPGSGWNDVLDAPPSNRYLDG